ncbi:hypothetical protein B5V02_00555 [Mesorhizobium kowhaii]|uniref:Uncharacterized protein n=1 Tax=Mesorhizobium kowhaii TaxID=1300272 RepID=A0A2W7CBV0_9HYPH|nr:hypothetical protein B5V02_00555 [Mesorhizobium kowhaii]
MTVRVQKLHTKVPLLFLFRSCDGLAVWPRGAHLFDRALASAATIYASVSAFTGSDMLRGESEPLSGSDGGYLTAGLNDIERTSHPVEEIALEAMLQI